MTNYRCRGWCRECSRQDREERKLVFVRRSPIARAWAWLCDLVLR